MPRKKTIEDPIEELPQELVVEEPIEADDDIIEKVVNKLKKVVTIKRELSEKQQQHLDTLASKRKGKRYELKVEPKDLEEIPKEIKKKKKVVKVIEESSSEEEEIVIVKKKKVVKAKSPIKPPVKQQVRKVIKKEPVPIIEVKRFNKSLF